MAAAKGLITTSITLRNPGLPISVTLELCELPGVMLEKVPANQIINRGEQRLGVLTQPHIVMPKWRICCWNCDYTL